MNGKKTATIVDVASLSGVSVSTVSRYLNKSGYVSADVERRVSEAVKALNYVPSRFARALKDSRTHQIGMVVPDITNPYYAAAYSAAQEYAEKHDYTVLLYNTSKKAESELKSLKVCRDMQVEGVVFFTERNHPDILSGLSELSVPVVFNAVQEPLLFDTVYSRGNGIYLTSKHLCDLGHERIAYSGGPADSHISQNRKSAYERALGETGLQVHSDYIFEMAFSMDSGYKSGMFFSSLRNPPTAIVAANDIIAMGVMIALNETGMRIPDDISLTGEDNIDVTKACRPTLTTTDNDPVYMSEKALDFLFDRLINGYSDEARIHICPRSLIVRDSTAPPKSFKDRLHGA